MKKLSIILCILLSVSSVVAQVPAIPNGDFTTNAGNDQIGAPCPMFSLTGTPNWFPTHGTPNYAGADEIFLWHDGSEGEGIGASYPFLVGQAYCVKVYLTMENYNNGILSIGTGNSISLGPPPVNCGSSVNFPGGFQVIGVMNAFTGSVGYFEYVPTVSTGILSIFPLGSTTSTNHCEVVIDKVEITTACVNNRCFVNGPIPSGVHYAKTICAGSVNLGPNPVTYIPGTVTELKASLEIDIKHDFEADANSSNYFLAETKAANCYCGPDAPSKIANSTTVFQPGMSESEGKKKMTAPVTDAVTSIYPNPNTGTFHVRFGKLANYKLRVTNAIGEVVYVGEVTDQEKFTIDLSTSLPSGNYLLYVEGDNVREVEKLTIIR